jgi:hypothetical protein
MLQNLIVVIVASVANVVRKVLQMLLKVLS